MTKLCVVRKQVVVVIGQVVVVIGQSFRLLLIGSRKMLHVMMRRRVLRMAGGVCIIAAAGVMLHNRPACCNEMPETVGTAFRSGRRGGVTWEKHGA